MRTLPFWETGYVVEKQLVNFPTMHLVSAVGKSEYKGNLPTFCGFPTPFSCHAASPQEKEDMKWLFKNEMERNRSFSKMGLLLSAANNSTWFRVTWS